MWKLTEVGLTCESYKKVGDETVLDVEVTANRPDWMCVTGIAREIAAIQGSSLKLKEPQDLAKPFKILPLKIKPDFSLFDRWTGVIISGVEVKPSPAWLREKMKQMGGHSINNIVDITNFVMYELGMPMHAFDYDEIKGSFMSVEKSKGGEEFISVDDLPYKLPKDAIIIRDSKRIIDLAGIKGGLNSGIKAETKNIFLHATIDNPVLIRRTSIALGLRSEASAIYERGPDKGGTLTAVKHAANLILELAGGEIASEMVDLKKQEFKACRLELGYEKMKNVLGIEIPREMALKILESLKLSPQKTKTGIVCEIPTYRGDIKIEEDLIEEVARIYSYNKFPKTLPEGITNARQIPYYFDDTFMMRLKELMVTSGYSEAMTLSLISKDLIEKCNLIPASHIKIENPVSTDYAYMRSSLVPSLLHGIKINREEKVQLFEIDKVYLGTPDNPKEIYKLATLSKGLTFRQFKGTIDLILQRLEIANYKIVFETKEGYWHPSRSAVISVGETIIGSFGEIHPQVASALSVKDKVFGFEFDIDNLQKCAKTKMFKPVPENPAQIEDLTLVFPPKTRIGEVIETIASMNRIIEKVKLKDIYKDSYTFRIHYQNPKKTLTNKEVEKIRKEILVRIKSKFGGTLKE